MDELSKQPTETKAFRFFLTWKEVVSSLILFGVLIFLHQQDYKIFHIFAEFFSIMVAMGMFIIAINTTHLVRNHYLSFLGIAYLSIGMLDALHALIFPGIGIFAQSATTDPTIQFWIFARYLEAFSLLAAPLFIHRKLYFSRVFSFYALVTILGSWIILKTDLFPQCFIEGEGLTPFKVGSEYFIAVILLSSIVVLKKIENDFDPRIFTLVTISILLTVASEMWFTFYTRPDSLSNVAGHFFKVASFFLIYKALIQQALTKPLTLIFRELQTQEAALSEANEVLELRVRERTHELEQIAANLQNEIAVREKAEQAQAESQLRLKAMMQAFPDMIFLLNAQGQLLEVTGSTEHLLLPKKELLGKSLSEILPPAVSLLFQQAIADALETNMTILVEYEYELSGEPHFFEARLVACGEGKVIQVTRDITARKNVEKEILLAKDAAQQANEAKSNFLATMSHELRTPMNGVLGMAQILLHTPLNEEQISFVKTITHSGEALVNILSDILDVAKIEENKVKVIATPINLAELIHGTIRLFAGSAKSKGLQLSYDLHSQGAQYYLMDGNLLRQILNNLIANAIKFTDQGWIKCAVKLMDTKGEMHHLRFSVEDTGIGIPQELHDSIFESFAQGDSTSTRRYGGSGLGLSIVRKLLQLMGGSIQVESQPGEGSRFYFDLLLQKAQDVTESNPKKLPKSASGLSQTILVVEDDQVNQEVVKRMLTLLGYQVQVAENGAVALNKLHHNAFDLILMDCLMPQMDGFEATQKIRAEESDQHIPIIALTAKAFTEDRDRCLASGMDDFIAKPLEIAVLRHTLDKWLRARKA